MAPITGDEAIIAVKKAAEWRTAVECGAGNGIMMKAGGLGAEVTKNWVYAEELGIAYLTERVSSGIPPVDDNIPCNARYEGLEILLALATGTAGTPVQQGETAAYKHTLKFASNLDGLFATVVILKKSDKVWEIPSTKIYGFDLSGGIGDALGLTFAILGNKWELASTVNTTTTIANVTVPDKHNVISYNEDTKIRMNAQSGAALSDSDRIFPRRITRLSFRRTLDSDLREAGYIDIPEPCRGGFPVVTLEIELDRYNVDSFLAAVESEAIQKMDLYFKGLLIEDTYYYEMLIQCPNVVVDTGTVSTALGKFPHTVRMTLGACDTAPAGMTGITNPFQIDLINKNSSDPLG